MKKCIVCKKREVTVPDRDDWPRYRVRLCEECHGDRLKKDLAFVAKLEKPRPPKAESPGSNPGGRTS